MDICAKPLIVKDHTGQRLPDLICCRKKGHEGNHQDKCGAVWLNTAPLIEAMRPVTLHYK